MLETVAIIGSMNVKSTTAEVVRSILDHISEQKGHSHKIIELSRKGVKHCVSCNNCFKEGFCLLDDDFMEIKNNLLNADLIIFASPVYVHNVSGIMKSVFDRLAMSCHNLEFAGKLGVSICTTGNSGAENVLNIMSSFQQAIGIKNICNFSFAKSSGDLNDFALNAGNMIMKSVETNYGYSNMDLEALFQSLKRHYDGLTEEIARENNINMYEWRYWNEPERRKCRNFQEFAHHNRVVLGKSLAPSSPRKFDLLKAQSDQIHPKAADIRNYSNALLGRILLDHDNKLFSPVHYGDLLAFITELLGHTNVDERLVQMGYSICREVKHIFENQLRSVHEGMFGGLGGLCFAVREFSKKTAMLKRFSNNADRILLQRVLGRVRSVGSFNYGVRAQDYDLISGVAGTLYYLLDTDLAKERGSEITFLIEYLLYLTDFYDYKGQRVIRFHISRENQNRRDEKELFRDGNINFGLAHGMVGVLVALAKAYSYGYSESRILAAANEVLSLYDTYSMEIRGIRYWPSQLTLNSYLDKSGVSPNEMHTFPSWCYGNIGIAKGMQKAHEYLGNSSDVRYYRNLIMDIVRANSVPNLHLSHSLCHGYSSMLSIYLTTTVGSTKSSFSVETGKLIDLILDRHKYIERLHLDKDPAADAPLYKEGLFTNYSLLEGAIGIALSLLGCIRGDLSFYRLLMID